MKTAVPSFVLLAGDAGLLAAGGPTSGRAGRMLKATLSHERISQGRTMETNRSLRIKLTLLWVCLLTTFVQPGTAKDKKPPPTKSIRGHVADAGKKSIAGAKVFVRNVNKNITTVLVTDEAGLYSVYGLDPKVDYEVHAEYRGFASERRAVSSFLNRFDNVFNFELGSEQGAGGSSAAREGPGARVELRAADQVKLGGSWFSPSGGKDTKFPTVLLVHGFGQDSRIWQTFVKDHLLRAGFAALSLDLRGHGDSAGKSGDRITAERTWISDPKQFPQDIDAALQWLKSREDVDRSRIAMIGCDLGADLAFLASGKYEEIRSAVALSGSVENAKHLAGGIENFQPHSILYVATQGDSAAAESARQLEKLTGFPVRAQIYENSGAHGSEILQGIPEASLLIMDWLKNM
jgi:pimeloyl-ACP methyl ester carboxylesterase